MPDTPEKLPGWKLAVFALGQLGWSLASYGVGSLVTYFYMPPDRMSAIVSSVICILGMLALFAYNERAVLRSLAKRERLTGGSAREVGLGDP